MRADLLSFALTQRARSQHGAAGASAQKDAGDAGAQVGRTHARGWLCFVYEEEFVFHLQQQQQTLEELYPYLSDQFRSMRQDLTVQNVKTDFAVLVYETNARIALAMSDLHEFNACQTQLWTLFQIVPGCTSVAGREREQRVEYHKVLSCFPPRVYWLSYLVFCSDEQRRRDVLHAEAKLVSRLCRPHCLARRTGLCFGFSHPIFFFFFAEPSIGQVRRACEDNDWVALRRLAASAPHGSATLLALLVRKVSKREAEETAKREAKLMICPRCECA